ncbi:MAG: TIM barrel protein [Actinomycetota bacterium]|nr:TIM barrel protein [Actinomycetota bacterium]
MMERVAGAPISWGVCEVPGWGYQLEPEEVLRQMQELGLRATEFGPVGFLPARPEAKVELLASFGLSAVGEFVPVVLHDTRVDPLPAVETALDGLVEAGADVVVLAAVTGDRGYGARPELDGDAWRRLALSLDRLSARARDRGITACLHPHVGTVVESGEDIDRVLTSSDVALCLDTGHALIGGADPVVIARDAAERIKHVHLKDVDLGGARRVQAGDVGYAAAVAQGMYRPLGRGDVDIAGIVGSLEGAGYGGWYVLEQDTVLAGRPEGTGPADDVAQSLRFLRSLDAQA